MNGVGRAVVAVAGAIAVLGGVRGAQGTVSSTLVADAYLVTDGAKTYSVLDIYAKGNHVGDRMGGSVLGAGTHGVVFATSSATGFGLNRDGSGKIIAGTITNDIFVHSGGTGWLPTGNDVKYWDSFIAVGNRGQGVDAKVTNRAGVVKDQGQAANMTAASGFSQMSVAGSSFIDSGTTSGWFSAFGGSGYSSAGSSENPFARVNAYNSDNTAMYPDLVRRPEMLVSKGAMQNGTTTAGAAAIGGGAAGTSLDFCWMIGRFAIDVTGKDASERITMNAQFNMVGKNGTAAEAGTTFTGAITASYKVSNFFAFAMPLPCPSDFDGNRLVDTADIGMMLLDFGDCQSCAGDLDGNGLVDTADISLLLMDFGACP
jgi:hypothetical protein